ncbi:MAG: hypothetical protein MRK02_07165 [Candidatus Scalindua sp.]|nr:hypothetical protein [Candidatus Scalindua sp.]
MGMWIDDANVCHYSLYGLTIAVRCEGKGVEDQIQKLFNTFPFMKLSDAGTPAHLTLQFASTEVSVDIPHAASGPLSCYDVSIFRLDDTVYITDGSSLFQLHPHKGVGFLTIHGSFQEKTPLSKYNLFLIGLIHLLSPRGFYELHGAALLRDGLGVLLLGDSGSGKSTATLSLVNQGWHYISDDALLLKCLENRVEVFSFRNKFYLAPELVHHYPEILPYLEESKSGADTKRFLDVESMYPNQFCSQGIPKILLFTSIVPEPESRLVPVDPTSALVKLTKQSASILFNRQTAKNHLEVLKQLVYQAESFQLLAGRDLHEEPGKITEVLSEISSKTS